MSKSTYPNPSEKLTHRECLYRLCLFCHQKHKLHDIKLTLLLKIEKLSVIKDLDAPHNAKAICESCRQQLYKPEGQAVLKQRRDVSLPHIDDLISISYNSNTCPCAICEIVKKNKPPTTSKRKIARPSKSTPKVICKSCQSPDCDGKQCKNTSVTESASKVVKENPRLANAITAQVIKATEPSPKGTIRLPQSQGGSKLPLTLGSSKKIPKKTEYSAKEVNELRVRLGKGVTGGREIGTFLNKKGGKGTVESGFQQKLQEMTHTLDEFFTVQDVGFLVGKKIVKKPLVYVKNLSEFCLHVIKKRGYNLFATRILLTVDNTESRSEYSISIIDLLEDKDAVRKSSGTSHALLVAVSPKVPENHFNFQKVFQIISVHQVKLFFINDLKATLVICGKQTAACKHRCPFCDSSDMTKCGKLCTVGSLVQQHQRWVGSQLDRKHLQFFGNVENLPLVTDDFEADKDKLILEFCPPPELHILLGIVNKAVKVLEERIPTAIVKEWVAFAEAQRNAYHGGTFNGNNCKRLVDAVDFLELLVTKDLYDFTPFALAMVDVLRKLRSVRHACYGTELLPNYQDALDQYQKATLNLVKDFSVNLILKDHIADFHVAHWIDLHGVGLGASSEQTAESVHNIFANKYWDPRFKVAETSPHFPRQLLRAVCAFDADRANFLTDDDE